MTTTAYTDPATGDLYVRAGETWHAFLGPYGHQAIIDDSVVPDVLELLVPLMVVRRDKPRLEAADVNA
jgi:hypothetical protein